MINQPAVTSGHAGPPRLGRQPWALLVEPQKSVRQLTELALSEAGLAVCSFASAHDALAHSPAGRRPQLVVLQTSLPLLPAATVATTLRMRYGAELPLIALTSDDRATASQLGAVAALRVPFEPSELVRLVAPLVRGGAQRSPIVAEPPSPTMT